jgi:hypothetical protein
MVRQSTERIVPVSAEVKEALSNDLGDEAMHWAILRNVLGEDPVPAAFVG